MLSWNADGELEQVAEAMRAASLQVASGEITTATRTVELNGVSVKAGEIIGLADGHICAAGESIPEILNRTLVALQIEEREILSIYYGADVSQEEAETIVSQIEEHNPDLEIELSHRKGEVLARVRVTGRSSAPTIPTTA